MSNSFDVIVAGAGPAGANAARHLALAGVSVALFEKAGLPRYKVCGGGVLARARALIADVPFPVEREIHSADLALPDTGHHFQVERPFPLVYMTMREDFDLAIVEAAQQAGARVFDGCPITSAHATSSGTTITAGGRQYQSKYLIAADGARSRVSKLLGIEDSRFLAPALEWEVRVNAVTYEKFAHTARFDYGAAAQGYGWVFPKRETLSVGALTTRRGRYPLKEVTAAYVRNLLGDANIESIESHGFVIPLAPRRGSLLRMRTLLAGDVAGLADPLTAEGITHALLSGQLAATALIEGDFDESSVRRLYDASMEQSILSELKIARFLADVLYTRPLLRRPIMSWFGQEFCEAMANLIAGKRTYRDLLFAPSKYFKLIARRMGRA